MPLLKIHSLREDSAWALWHMRESEEQLSVQSEEVCPQEIVNPQKRLEWLTGRILMKNLLENFGLLYHGLSKDEFGKPFLNQHPHHISLSHSYPYVVAQIDQFKPIGIDLEQPKEKLKKIAHRVFNKDETDDAGDNVVKLCVYWCAKEALYKLYGKKNLQFTKNLAINSFQLERSGALTGKIKLDESETSVALQYLVMEDYVVVYTDTSI